MDARRCYQGLRMRGVNFHHLLTWSVPNPSRSSRGAWYLRECLLVPALGSRLFGILTQSCGPPTLVDRRRAEDGAIRQIDSPNQVVSTSEPGHLPGFQPGPNDCLERHPVRSICGCKSIVEIHRRCKAWPGSRC